MFPGSHFPDKMYGEQKVVEKDGGFLFLVGNGKDKNPWEIQGEIVRLKAGEIAVFNQFLAHGGVANCDAKHGFPRMFCYLSPVVEEASTGDINIVDRGYNCWRLDYKGYDYN